MCVSGNVSQLFVKLGWRSTWYKIRCTYDSGLKSTRGLVCIRLGPPSCLCGSSTTQHNDGPAGALTAPPHSWSNGVDSIFRVRGKGYMQDRIKVPPGELGCNTAVASAGNTVLVVVDTSTLPDGTVDVCYRMKAKFSVFYRVFFSVCKIQRSALILCKLFFSPILPS